MAADRCCQPSTLGGFNATFDRSPSVIGGPCAIHRNARVGDARRRVRREESQETGHPAGRPTSRAGYAAPRRLPRTIGLQCFAHGVPRAGSRGCRACPAPRARSTSFSGPMAGCDNRSDRESVTSRGLDLVGHSLRSRGSAGVDRDGGRPTRPGSGRSSCRCRPTSRSRRPRCLAASTGSCRAALRSVRRRRCRITPGEASPQPPAGTTDRNTLPAASCMPCGGSGGRGWSARVV